jgi:hypothetical protein
VDAKHGEFVMVKKSVKKSAKKIATKVGKATPKKSTKFYHDKAVAAVKKALFVDA